MMSLLITIGDPIILWIIHGKSCYNLIARQGVSGFSRIVLISCKPKIFYKT
jgi:hypothetical protein